MFTAGLLTGFAIPFAAAFVLLLIGFAISRTKGVQCLVAECWLDIECGTRMDIAVWWACARHDIITRRRAWHKEARAKSPRNRANWGKDD